MPTLKNNSYSPIDCRAIQGINTILVCGNNIEIDKEVYDKIKQHPTLASMLERGILSYVDYDIVAEGTRGRRLPSH
jgi:hypothetical protein